MPGKEGGAGGVMERHCVNADCGVSAFDLVEQEAVLGGHMTQRVGGGQWQEDGEH